MLKKIETQEDRDRKARRVKIIVSVVMVVLIGLSSLGYALMSKNDGSSVANVVNYASLKFVQNNGFWTTSINEKVFYFNYLPTEIQNVTIAGNYSLEDYYQKTIYIVNINSAASGILYALDGISTRVQEACLNQNNCSNKDLPVKNCSDNLIVFSDSNISSVSKNENCVIISGNSLEGTDKFLYRLLGID